MGSFATLILIKKTKDRITKKGIIKFFSDFLNCGENVDVKSSRIWHAVIIFCWLQSNKELFIICKELSFKLKTYVIGAIIHDGSILFLKGYYNKSKIFYYISNPGYFINKCLPPKCKGLNNMKILCLKNKDKKEMGKILKNKYFDEILRLAALMNLWCIPAADIFE